VDTASPCALDKTHSISGLRADGRPNPPIRRPADCGPSVAAGPEGVDQCHGSEIHNPGRPVRSHLHDSLEPRLQGTDQEGSGPGREEK
jgi:hypothetical protein